MPTEISTQNIDKFDFGGQRFIPEMFFALNYFLPTLRKRDLPEGQLAEATITGFDDSGKPNAGKILIDDDVNGVGWFIDDILLNNSKKI